MPTIPNQGFCIHLQRIRQEKRAGIGFARTIGNYTCYFNGEAVAGLAGQMVEAGGPGSNIAKNVRVKEGTFPLATHIGPSYRTFGWKPLHLLPALELDLSKITKKRDGILIHPCHDVAHHYLSSIGCLNPASGLVDAKSNVDLDDSLNRTLALIDELQKVYATLPKEGDIPNAVIIIEGEPS
jgi:hypothetical protein